LLVAREVATVDLLTEGRLQLGLGAVDMQSEYEQAGLDFDAGGTRAERLAEGLLNGEQVALAGRQYRVTAARSSCRSKAFAHAVPQIRLACQLRPQADIAVIRGSLLPDGAEPDILVGSRMGMFLYHAA
jgi:hypothetical protein